jgi:thioredoxin reductase
MSDASAIAGTGTATLARPEADTVAVIGAGLSGLVACAELRHRGIACVCFEREPELGGVWRRHRDVVSVTSRDAMGLEALPLPPGTPDFPTGRHLVDWMEEYADEYSLREHIHFDTAVAGLAREDGRWRVTLENGESSTHRAVVVATGRIGPPTWPELKGEFDGRMLHVGELEDPSELAGQRVAVIGFGNSAVDAACQVSRHAETTYLAVRTGAWVVPRYFAGRPLDKASGPLLTRVPLWARWPFYRAMLYMIQGSMESYGLPAPAEKPGRRPLTVSDELLPRIGAGKVVPVAAVEALEGEALRLADGSRIEADAVVCATGYDISVPLLDAVLADLGVPLRGHLWHNFLHPRIPDLYVLGAMVAFGAIPPLVEAQARLVANLISGYGALPSREDVRRDLDRDAALRARFARGPTREWMVGETPAFLARLRQATERSTGEAMRDRPRGGAGPPVWERSRSAAT